MLLSHLSRGISPRAFPYFQRFTDHSLQVGASDESIRLVLNPDGTDSLWCRECVAVIQDGDGGLHLGDICPVCGAIGGAL